MRSLLSAPHKFRRFLLHFLAAVAIGLLNILNASKSENAALIYSPFSFSSLANKSLEHFDASAGMILRESFQSRNPKNRSRLPLRDHPHAGARDKYGNWGYFADHQGVRKRLLKMYKQHSGKRAATYSDMIRFLPLDIDETELVCNTPPTMGAERMAWDMMTRKIEIGGPAPLPLDPTKHPREPPKGWETLNLSAPIPPFDANVPPYRNKPHPPKIGCFMYSHEERHGEVWGAAQTWGWRCDGFLAFSTRTDPNIGTVDLPHLGASAYENMWQKVRSIWAYIHDNYIEDFDYFYLAGDDTYVIVENLRNYLWSIDDENGTKPLYIGSPYWYYGGPVCVGGSGYIFNRVTLQRFVEEVLPFYYVNDTDSREDFYVGDGISSFARCYRTHDARGAIRFYYFGPRALANFDGKDDGDFADAMYKNHDNQPTIKFFFNQSFRKEDLLSSQLITWHWIKTRVALKRMNAIMYRSCPKGTILADALNKIDNHRTSS